MQKNQFLVLVLVGFVIISNVCSAKAPSTNPNQPITTSKAQISVIKTNATKTVNSMAATATPQKIDQLLAEFGENINVGILVQEINTGKTIYSRNATRYFLPASNQKLLTAFAALNYLDPNFSYQTRLFVDTAKVENGVLNDNIYIQFTGDPTFSFSQLDKLIASLERAGIKKITGKIILDDTAFDEVMMSPGTTWDDKNFCFGSPLSATILDHNCVGATLAPSVNNQLVTINSASDQPQFIRFINNVTTRPDGTNCKIDVKAINDSTYSLTGCLQASEAPKSIWLAVINPRLNMQNAVTYAFQKNKIEFAQITFEKINSPVVLFNSEASLPMISLINVMLKESDNTIANSLFKTIGALYFGDNSGKWENGSDAIRDILNRTMRLPLSKYTVIDGAGGSRYNYVTPLQLITLLRYAYFTKNSTAFISSLPISGIDGTLKMRMNVETMRGKVHAKTGTETGVTSLAGYIETRQKKILAFAILINGFVDSPTRYKLLEDKICATLFENN